MKFIHNWEEKKRKTCISKGYCECLCCQSLWIYRRTVAVAVAELIALWVLMSLFEGSTSFCIVMRIFITWIVWCQRVAWFFSFRFVKFCENYIWLLSIDLSIHKDSSNKWWEQFGENIFWQFFQRWAHLFILQSKREMIRYFVTNVFSH